MMKRYQYGFRMLPCDRWNTPYTDLPEFVATFEDMCAGLDELQCSFIMCAEWRCVEVIR